jgi:hypothetical protein
MTYPSTARYSAYSKTTHSPITNSRFRFQRFTDQNQGSDDRSPNPNSTITIPAQTSQIAPKTISVHFIHRVIAKSALSPQVGLGARRASPQAFAPRACSFQAAA